MKDIDQMVGVHILHLEQPDAGILGQFQVPAPQDLLALQNIIPTSGNWLRVLRNEDDPSPCARLANEMRDERAERLNAEPRALSPGRDVEYLNFIDPGAFGQ